MKFGVCTSLDHAPALKTVGWDYVEESVQGLLQGLIADEQWKGEERVRSAALRVPCANLLVPASLKITGPEADLGKLRAYMKVVAQRAKWVGIEIMVFGSGGARNVPDGFDRGRAREQIVEFAKVAAEEAGRHGVVIVVEPLNR